MSRKSQIALVGFFLAVIYGVGVVQGLVEMNQNKARDTKRSPPVQFFDLLEDTFLHPRRRANKIADLFRELDTRIALVEAEFAKGRQALAETPSVRAWADSGDGAESVVPESDWDYGRAADLLDETLFAARDIRREVMNVNRHVAVDTTGVTVKEMANPLFAVIDRMIEPVENRYMRVDAMCRSIAELYEATSNEGGIEKLTETLDKVKVEVTARKSEYPRLGLGRTGLLALQHFMRYTVFSRPYLRAYEKEIEKTSVFANTLRPPMQFVRYMLLGDVGSKAVQGRNGWLFYKPGFEYLVRPHVTETRSLPKKGGGSVLVDYTGNVVKDAIIDTILSFRNQLAERGVDLLLVVVPGKPSIYPDLLSPGMGRVAAGKASHSVKFIGELRAAGVEVVDLFGPFGEERQRDAGAGDSMYLATDTHWRARGLRLAAKTVGQRVKEYEWYREGTVEYVIDTVTVDREGDVGVMTTLPSHRVRDLTLKFALESTKCFQVSEVGRDEEGNLASKRLYHTMKGPYSRQSDILLIGDSFTRIYQEDAPFGAGWVAHLAVELSQPVGYHYNDGGASTLVREWLVRSKGLLKNKKLLIWEFVERDLRFGEQGWKDLKL